jgi:ABC-type glycerol-3-phosphate transport system permease component
VLESARIDGAGHFSIFWRIMMPMSAPVLGAYAILHFMSVWNAYTWPVLVATKQSVQPIMVVLPQLVDPHIGFLPVWGTIMAGCVLSTIPLLVVFIAFQDKFMSSVTIGAVKG